MLQECGEISYVEFANPGPTVVVKGFWVLYEACH